MPLLMTSPARLLLRAYRANAVRAAILGQNMRVKCTFWHCCRRIRQFVDELSGEKGCFGFSRANVRLVKVRESIFPVPIVAFYYIWLRIVELLRSLPLLFLKRYLFLRHLPFSGAGTGMGTTTTCQNRMATFLGRKYATCSPAFFGIIRAQI
jgi:hypothetical protein